VGDGSAAEFLTFLDTQSLPDPEDVLATSETLQLPRRGDLAVAIVRSILARVESDNSGALWELRGWELAREEDSRLSRKSVDSRGAT
jgi:hypothetical protein